MKYKLICLDMDGTLFDDNKQISQRTITAVRKAVKKGVKVAICTGRLFTSANYYAGVLGIEVPVISANGAYIREKDRDEVIYKSVLEEENCRLILKLCEKHGVCPNFHTPDGIFTSGENKSSSLYEKYNKEAGDNHRIKIEFVKDWNNIFRVYKDDILKCISIDEDLEKIQRVKEELVSYSNLEVVSSHYNNFEVMKKGVSKGRGAEILAGFYNVKRDEVICIGDNENDMSMIEYAGLGIAMGNSSQEILKSADYVTDSNNNDGVAKAIEKFILND
jgi:Cof subfamily protein (haloacid dehalogenase superfamily)